MPLVRRGCSRAFLILILVHTAVSEDVALILEKTSHDSYQHWCITNSTEAITFIPKNNHHSKYIFNIYIKHVYAITSD